MTRSSHRSPAAHIIPPMSSIIAAHSGDDLPRGLGLSLSPPSPICPCRHCWLGRWAAPPFMPCIICMQPCMPWPIIPLAIPEPWATAKLLERETGSDIVANIRYSASRLEMSEG